MTMTYNCYQQNQKGAKEAGEFLAKPFKLEQALYSKVKEHEEAEIAQLKPKTNREKKAVDFFLRRRQRCDRYIKESVAPNRPDDGLTDEERAKLEEERLQKELLEKARGIQVETVEVTPIKGEIKMAPLSTNTNNNGNTATPFSSECASQRSGQVWRPVNWSTSEGINGAMVNSVMSSCSNSLFDCPANTPLYASTKKQYKPVNYMNFKSKQPKSNYNFNKNAETACVDDILKRVHAKEEAAKRMEEEAKRRNDEASNKSHGPRPNGVDAIGLAKISLPGKTGKWRPSNDNWRPGVNTDGFFTALAALNEKKEANKNKPVIYSERSYNTSSKAFADNSLATALNNL